MIGAILNYPGRAVLVYAAIMFLPLGLPSLSRASEAAATNSAVGDSKTTDGIPQTATYGIHGDGNPRDPLLKVAIDDAAAATSPVPSLDKALADLQHRAAAVLNKTNDVFAAIGIMAAGVPRLDPADMNGLTAESRHRMAWYAGLLVQTHARSAEGLALLKSLATLAPQDPLIGDLEGASVQWAGLIAGKTGPNSSLLSVATTSLTPGSGDDPIYVTSQYIVAARWCGTYVEHKLQRSFESIPRGLMTESQALEICRAGAAGVAVYDAKDLRLLLYVPVVVSDDVVAAGISSVAVFRNVAYVAFYDANLAAGLGEVPAILSIDLKTGRTIARKKSESYDQLRVIGDQLFGCGQTLPPCKQIDPVTLKVVGEGSETGLPWPFVTDAEVSQILSWGLGGYIDSAIALTQTRILVASEGRDSGFKSVLASDRAEAPIAGGIRGTAVYGVATPDGKHAYLLLLHRESGGITLARADFDTANGVTVADGSFGVSAGIVSMDQFIVDWNNGGLEVRNSNDGSLVCIWSGLLKAKDFLKSQRDPLRMFLVNSGNSLVLTANPSATDDIQPSVVLDVAKIKFLSAECGSTTVKAKRALDMAMAPMQ